ncbi:barwin-like endoglucanase [Coprinopsis marcescibilis]|uniref:Barwin-like endoglucanase n=1 Tax=Coprinopsis marcescibilis TaxID=230819 RepID=A0A5C3LDK6_COPMA|nr:barwin-like endoglucanase [Coprinopsis marcescibilis]
MLSLVKLAVFCLAASATLAAAAHRADPPSGWAAGYLEPYHRYHARYLVLACDKKHDTPFFDQCCHPLLRSESLRSSRLDHCNPDTPSAVTDEESEECEPDSEERVISEETSAFPTHAIQLSVASKDNSDAKSQPQDVEADANASDDSGAASSPLAKMAATADVNGGFATYYYQNGVAGACGKVHTDKELIAAMSGGRYGNLGAVSKECGKKVRIVNNKNGKSVTVTIADACPTCNNDNSIDLSEYAFQRIAPLSDGIVPITWNYV